MRKHDLLPDMRYLMIPGGVVVGEIVKAAQHGQGKLKKGTRVVGASPLLSCRSWTSSRTSS